MSKKHIEKITCCHCHSQQSFTIWESVNASIDPILKQKLLKGELATFVCQKCGNESHVEYNCLYHDMDRSLLISLIYPDTDGNVNDKPALKFPFAEKYIYRTVNSFEELIEKILVFDDGLSDHAIELMKLLICFREEIDICCPFHYAGIESTWIKKTLLFVLTTEQGFNERCYEMKQYRNLTKTIMPKISSVINSISDEWPRVNRKFMLHVLEASGLIGK